MKNRSVGILKQYTDIESNQKYVAVIYCTRWDITIWLGQKLDKLNSTSAAVFWNWETAKYHQKYHFIIDISFSWHSAN